MDRGVDLIFRERPFLEDMALPQEITELEVERYEHCVRLKQLSENVLVLLQDMLDKQMAL